MEKLLNILITPIIFIMGLFLGVLGAVFYLFYALYYMVSAPIRFLIMFWRND